MFKENPNVKAIKYREKHTQQGNIISVKENLKSREVLF